MDLNWGANRRIKKGYLVGERVEPDKVFVGISPDTKKPLHALSKDFAKTLTFAQARKIRIAESADGNGERPVRLPTLSELKLMFEYRQLIGGFNQAVGSRLGWYWSSTFDGDPIADEPMVVCFRDGRVDCRGTGAEASVRFVDDGPA